MTKKMDRRTFLQRASVGAAVGASVIMSACEQTFREKTRTRAGTPKPIAPDLNAIGTAAAEALLAQGYRYILITDPHHYFRSPRHIAASVMDAVVKEHDAENTFFGIEMRPDVGSPLYFQNKEVDALAVEDFSNDYPKGYAATMGEFLKSANQGIKLIYMDENANLSIEKSIRAKEAALKVAEDEKQNTVALLKAEINDLYTQRVEDCCNTWPASINTHKGKATAGVIMGGVGHFDPKDPHRTCDVLQSFQEKSGLTPIAMINIAKRDWFIAPASCDNVIQNHTITIHVPDEYALALLETNRNLLKTHITQPQCVRFALQALYDYNNPATIKDKVGIDTYINCVGEVNQGNMQNAETHSKTLLAAIDASPNKDHVMLVVAKEALQKGLGITKAVPTPGMNR